MTSHDQLGKLLLQTMFREFLAAFAPAMHKGLGPARIEFLNKELIRLYGVHRKTKVVDLAARVQLKGKEGFVVVHVELQGQRDRMIGQRLLLYNTWLMQQFGLPVYPILLTSYARPRNREPNRYQVTVRGFRVIDFRYQVVQLNRLDWRRYARLKNPAATALMARMKIVPKDRVKVRLKMLRLMTQMRLEPAKMEIIGAFMETYLKMTAKEELAFEQALGKIRDSKEKKKVMQLMTSWERKGRQEGRQEGRRKGRHEGQLATITRQLQLKFGTLAPAVQREILRLDEHQLDELTGALLGFSTLADLESWLVTIHQPNGLRTKRNGHHHGG